MEPKNERREIPAGSFFNLSASRIAQSKFK